LWVSGKENMTIRNNDIGYATYASIRIHGMMPHGPDRDINNHVFNVEFNDIHDYGLGILNDLGAVYISPSEIKCDLATETELLQHCSVYSHIYNNRIRRGNTFHNGANSLYGDVSSCKTTFENNVMYGPGTNVFYHHCGLTIFQPIMLSIGLFQAKANLERKRTLRAFGRLVKKVTQTELRVLKTIGTFILLMILKGFILEDPLIDITILLLFLTIICIGVWHLVTLNRPNCFPTNITGLNGKSLEMTRILCGRILCLKIRKIIST